MDARAHAEAERAVERAADDFARLQQAETREDLIEAWEDFLNRVARVYEKLKAGARGYPDTWGWFGRIQDERRDDELLRYVHHARNADHHRFEEVAEFERRGVGLFGPGTGLTYIDEMIINRGKVEKVRGFQLGAERPAVVQYPNHLRPMPVTDAGVVYPVPDRHFGRPLQTQSVVEIASQTMNYLRALTVAGSHFLR